MKTDKEDYIPVHGCATCGHGLCAKKVSLFSKLNDTQLHDVISLIDRKHYKKGEVIIKTGDDFNRLYIVNKGALKASSYQEDGKEQILYLLNDGDCIGELALLKSEPAVYDLIAVKESFICTITKVKFDDYLKSNPDMIFAIMTSAHDKIRSLEKLVGAIASNDVDVRLKFLLKQLMHQSTTKSPQDTIIQLQLTREDMANFVGVTRETISRKLSQLAQDQILELIDSRQLRIIDPSYFED